MTPAAPFTIVYAQQTKAHLKSIEPKYYTLIQRVIETRLGYEPNIKSKNRKPLQRQVVLNENWELRFGPENRFRVFYKVDAEQKLVTITAIGITEGNKLFIGGEEIDL